MECRLINIWSCSLHMYISGPSQKKKKMKKPGPKKKKKKKKIAGDIIILCVPKPTTI